MNLSFNQMKGVVDTLPVGFYCGRQVPVELSKEQEMSSYSPQHDCIIISANQLGMGLDACETMEEANTVIRSNFYHELSHAILTPRDMKPTTAVNIVEDERIERICKDTYYGVDFEKTLLKINGGEEALKNAPTSSHEAFFRLVRFGIGEKKWLDRVDKLLESFKGLTRESRGYRFDGYVQEIKQLYYDFAGEYDQEQEEEVYGEGSKSEGSDGEGAAAGRAYAPGKGEKGLHVAVSFKEYASSILAPNINMAFHQRAEMLFNNYRKKNSKGGSISGYSGAMNARSTGREDFRFFERPSPMRGGNPYGTLHLNLFIDTSGSFSSNDNATNAILHSLSSIERKNPNFSFDVVTTGADEILLDRKNRYIKSGGGNHLSKKIHRLFRTLQKPQTGNYNIILFDGDAYSNDCVKTSDWYGREEMGKGFSAFANNSCTIISDTDNKEYIDRYCPNTHTIYTNNYVKELYDNVLKALQRALI